MLRSLLITWVLSQGGGGAGGLGGLQVFHEAEHVAEVCDLAEVLFIHVILDAQWFHKYQKTHQPRWVGPSAPVAKASKTTTVGAGGGGG